MKRRIRFRLIDFPQRKWCSFILMSWSSSVVCSAELVFVLFEFCLDYSGYEVQCLNKWQYLIKTNIFSVECRVKIWLLLNRYIRTHIQRTYYMAHGTGYPLSTIHYPHGYPNTFVIRINCFISFFSCRIQSQLFYKYTFH